MQNALSIFLQHPVTGTGMGAYLVSQNEFPIKQSYFFLQPVHNVVLLFITQAGLLLGGYTLYLLYTFFRSVRYPAFYYLTFAAILITGMVDHYWLTLQQNWLLLPVITALPFTLLKTHEKNN
jgi:O-antigen ligase